MSAAPTPGARGVYAGERTIDGVAVSFDGEPLVRLLGWPPEAELAVDSPATVAPAGKGGLRRALGEERRRDFAVPFEATGESAAWSLASDRELR